MAQTSNNITASRFSREQDETTSISSSRIAEMAEWEANEAVRQRELEEARGRAAQMEKTMRWWSDCTANWREKWSKVRNERNKAREESKQLRCKLDTIVNEISTHKRDKEDLEAQNKVLRKEMERVQIFLLKHASQFDSQIFEALGEDPIKEFLFNKSNSCPNQNTDNSVIDQLNAQKNFDEYLIGNVPSFPAGVPSANGKVTPKSDRDETNLSEKQCVIEKDLDGISKALEIEREENVRLSHLIEKLTNELQEFKEKCEELKLLRQDTDKEIGQLQGHHQDEIRSLKLDLQEETNSKDRMEKRMNDLRAELERLQLENAAEWGKREQVETEKMAFERDNKKLRTELQETKEKLERKGRPLSNCSDTELKQFQQELSEKNKEISDLRHAQIKLKKLVQDKMTELAHAVRRAEQYECEVKKLRIRVEDLKKDVAVVEDELDSTSNTVKKLQRENDELHAQVEHFQIVIQHIPGADEKEDGGEEMAELDENDANSLCDLTREPSIASNS